MRDGDVLRPTAPISSQICQGDDVNLIETMGETGESQILMERTSNSGETFGFTVILSMC